MRLNTGEQTPLLLPPRSRFGFDFLLLYPVFFYKYEKKITEMKLLWVSKYLRYAVCSRGP